MKKSSSKKKTKPVPKPEGEILPIPTKAKDMLNMIDRFLAGASEEAIDLWAVLSALRGPDDDDDTEDTVKRATTAIIRSTAFPLTHHSSSAVIGMSGIDGKKWAAVRRVLDRENLEEYNHFVIHAQDAFEVLELKWGKTNPKPKK